jgi:WD40 repeat protein
MSRIITDCSLKLQSTQQLAEYITKVAISVNGQVAAASAGGEVLVDSQLLLEDCEQSIDALEFSSDGNFLAAAGQSGKIYIWQIKATTSPELIETIDLTNNWLEHLRWNGNLLAFSWQGYTQVREFPSKKIITTLEHKDSNILGMAWRPPLFKELSLLADKIIKIYDSDNWDDEPITLYIEAVPVGLAWSNDGRYLAVNRLDKSVSLFEWGNTDPWLLHGFLGKVRQMTFSASREPILAMATINQIVTWKRSKKAGEGWLATMLEAKEQDNIEALAFAPNSEILASVSESGTLALWFKGRLIGQVQADAGLSCLAWLNDSKAIVTGGQDGSLNIWKVIQSGKGFA